MRLNASPKYTDAVLLAIALGLVYGCAPSPEMIAVKPNISIKYSKAIGLIWSRDGDHSANLVSANALLGEAAEIVSKYRPTKAEAKDPLYLTKPENCKVFLGESHEQMVLFMMKGLLEIGASGIISTESLANARADFRSGQYTDRASSELPNAESTRQDCLALAYLEALCDQQLGDTKSYQECMNWLSGKCDDKRSLPSNANGSQTATPFNTIIVFFSGLGPTKHCSGKYGELLRYGDGSGAHGSLQLYVDGDIRPSMIAPLPVDIVSYQQNTRGNREIETALCKKAGVKGVADGFGEGINAVGLAPVYPWLLVPLVSGIQALAVRAHEPIKAHADARMLWPLPDDIYVFPLNLSKGYHEVLWQCPVSKQTVVWGLQHNGGSCEVTFYWFPGFGDIIKKAKKEADAKAPEITNSDELWWGTCEVGYKRHCRLAVRKLNDEWELALETFPPGQKGRIRRMSGTKKDNSYVFKGPMPEVGDKAGWEFCVNIDGNHGKGLSKIIFQGKCVFQMELNLTRISKDNTPELSVILKSTIQNDNPCTYRPYAGLALAKSICKYGGGSTTEVEALSKQITALVDNGNK